MFMQEKDQRQILANSFYNILTNIKTPSSTIAKMLVMIKDEAISLNRKDIIDELCFVGLINE